MPPNRSTRDVRQDGRLRSLREWADLVARSLSSLVGRYGTASGHLHGLRLAGPLLSSSALVGRPLDPIGFLSKVAAATPCESLNDAQLLKAGEGEGRPTPPTVASVHALPPSLSIEVQEGVQVCVVRLRGELDAATVDRAQEGLGSVSCSVLRVDLAELTFCDAGGLATLLTAKRHAEARGCTVQIVGARGIVRRVFDVTGLSHELAD